MPFNHRLYCSSSCCCCCCCCCCWRGGPGRVRRVCGSKRAAPSTSRCSRCGTWWRSWRRARRRAVRQGCGGLLNPIAKPTHAMGKDHESVREGPAADERRALEEGERRPAGSGLGDTTQRATPRRMLSHLDGTCLAAAHLAIPLLHSPTCRPCLPTHPLAQPPIYLSIHQARTCPTATPS